MRVTGQLNDGSHGSRVAKCDPLLALFQRGIIVDVQCTRRLDADSLPVASQYSTTKKRSESWQQHGPDPPPVPRCSFPMPPHHVYVVSRSTRSPLQSSDRRTTEYSSAHKERWKLGSASHKILIQSTRLRSAPPCLYCVTQLKSMLVWL